MDTTDILFKVITSVGTLSAVIFSVLAFIRSGRKDTEDKIYQLKVEAYKELTAYAIDKQDNLYPLRTYLLEPTNNDLWDFFKSVENKEHTLILDPNCFFKHMVILPTHIIEAWYELADKYHKTRSLVDNYTHNSATLNKANEIHPDNISEAVGRINTETLLFINKCRNDLLINDIHISLTNRLKQTYHITSYKNLVKIAHNVGRNLFN